MVSDIATGLGQLNQRDTDKHPTSHALIFSFLQVKKSVLTILEPNKKCGRFRNTHIFNTKISKKPNKFV